MELFGFLIENTCWNIYKNKTGKLWIEDPLGVQKSLKVLKIGKNRRKSTERLEKTEIIERNKIRLDSGFSWFLVFKIMPC